MGRIVSGLVVLLLLIILPKFLLRKWKYRRYVPVQARVDSMEKREERIDRDTVNSPEYWAKISFEWEGELRTCSWGPLSRSPEEGKEMGIRFDPSNGDWTPWEEESRLEKKKDLFVIFAAFFLGFSAVLVRFFDENVQISLPELWIPRLVCLLTGTGFLGSLAVWWGGYCSFRRKLRDGRIRETSTVFVGYRFHRDPEDGDRRFAIYEYWEGGEKRQAESVRSGRKLLEPGQSVVLYRDLCSGSVKEADEKPGNACSAALLAAGLLCFIAYIFLLRQ